MRAALHDPALVEHDDLVGIAACGKPMRDHEGRPVLGDKIERVLNLAFGEGVERRGCLVENEDRRRLENGSGDGDALLFAAREFEAAFADLRLVAARNMFDEMVDSRQTRCLADRGVTRVEAAVTDIIGDRVVKKYRV